MKEDECVRVTWSKSRPGEQTARLSERRSWNGSWMRKRAEDRAGWTKGPGIGT